MGITVVCLSLAAIWLDMRKATAIQREQWDTQQQLEHVGKLIGLRASVLPTPPESLDGLEEHGLLVDGWGRPFIYEVHGTNFTLLSYGRDGKPGGTGADADLTNWNPEPAESQVLPTFCEFVFELSLTRTATFTTLVCGVLAALVGFYTLRIPKPTCVALAGAGLRLAATILAATFIGFLIGGLHVPHH